MFYFLQVLYVGDHIYGDILRSKKVLGIICCYFTSFFFFFFLVFKFASYLYHHFITYAKYYIKVFKEYV
jgi:hypothetical protein